MFRSLYLGAVAIVFAGSAASAQITTYVAPPRPAEEARQAIATADSARRDSVASATMANMKAWVDSAAGVSVPGTVGVTDTAVGEDPARPVTSFSDGAVAPATASPLPSLVLVGAAAVLVGAALLTTRPRG